MVKILGVYFGTVASVARDRSWSELLLKVRNRLALWKMRCLSLKGKVVVNNLVLSVILHTLNVHGMPKERLHKLQSAISSFLWRGGGNLIAHSTLIGKVKEGGLAYRDIATFKDAARIKVIKKFL